jgi:Fungal chitosanase of glycosyl hydrolase group 75
MYNTRLLFNFHKTRILGIDELNITCFTKGMAIDADGHPFAYHPDNSGLDDLKHAGYPGNWWALATHDATTAGVPVIQKTNDPAPGYYVSTTSLFNEQFPYDDPRRYVDAASIPYFVLPDKFKPSISLGDFAWIYNRNNAQRAFAIFADVGPDVGEGSMFLANQLGIDEDPRYGGMDCGIMYFIFDGSRNNNSFVLSASEIQQKGKELMKDIDPYSLINIFST